MSGKHRVGFTVESISKWANGYERIDLGYASNPMRVLISLTAPAVFQLRLGLELSATSECYERTVIRCGTFCAGIR